MRRSGRSSERVGFHIDRRVLGGIVVLLLCLLSWIGICSYGYAVSGDATEVFKMRVREVPPGAERDKLWAASAEAFPPYLDYEKKAPRLIPVFVCEPV